MSGSSQVDLNEWKLETVFSGDQTTHYTAGYPTGIWKRGQALGRGGFGEVWKETRNSNPSEEPQVRAIKRIRKTEKATQELPNLIKLSTKKYHGPENLKHFVEFFGWYEDQHNIYVSMEYIPNHDLQQHITERHGNGFGFHESEGAFIVAKISKALKFMHEKNVMHRDLKPANILISNPGPSWQIKLADFGISKGIELSGAQTKAGTDGYMAPEVADTNRRIPYTSAVDIWSLGAVAFCIHTGKPPFQDNLAVGRYIDGKGAFPFDPLLKFSGKLVIFIMQLMDVMSTRRPDIDQVLQHEWVGIGDDKCLDQESEVSEVSEHGQWSAPASAEWDSSQDSAIEDRENSKQPSSLPDFNQDAVDTPHPRPSPIKTLTSLPQQLHHAASNPVGEGMRGYGGTLPPRPSSSPAEDVKRKSVPILIENPELYNPELYTYGDNFRHRHDLPYIDHGAVNTSQDPPLTEMHPLSPTKAPAQMPLPSSHPDSGYITTSNSSISPQPKSAEIQKPVAREPTRNESLQPYASHLLLKGHTADQNHAPMEYTTPPQQNKIKRNTGVSNLKDQSGAGLSSTDNYLIDFGDPSPGLVDNTPQAPRYAPLPWQHNIKGVPIFGPFLPDDNPWA